jgi:Ca-activated chloride channel family protein
MSFAWPHLLWLILLPAAWLGRELGRRRRQAATAHPHIARAQAGSHGLALAAEERGGGPAGWASLLGSKARARIWLCLGLAFGILALARPQWGRIDEPVFEQAREIVIAVDLSRSMLTTDVKPSRLERAKLLIQSLLDRLTGERVGLISFAGPAFLQAPLSAD